VANSNWHTQRGMDQQIDRRQHRQGVNARRFTAQSYAAEFPRYQKLLLLVMTAAMLLAAATSGRTAELPGDTVFRTVGSNGEVSFNNLGDGAPVDLVRSPQVSSDDREAQRLRQAEILELADRLAQERHARSRHRAEIALVRSRTNSSPAPIVANRGSTIVSQPYGFFGGNRFGFVNNRRANLNRVPGFRSPSLRNPSARPAAGFTSGRAFGTTAGRNG